LRPDLGTAEDGTGRIVAAPPVPRVSLDPAAGNPGVERRVAAAVAQPGELDARRLARRRAAAASISQAAGPRRVLLLLDRRLRFEPAEDLPQELGPSRDLVDERLELGERLIPRAGELLLRLVLRR